MPANQRTALAEPRGGGRGFVPRFPQRGTAYIIALLGARQPEGGLGEGRGGQERRKEGKGAYQSLELGKVHMRISSLKEVVNTVISEHI